MKGKGPSWMEVHMCLRHGEIQPFVPTHQASVMDRLLWHFGRIFFFSHSEQTSIKE